MNELYALIGKISCLGECDIEEILGIFKNENSLIEFKNSYISNEEDYDFYDTYKFIYNGEFFELDLIEDENL